MGAGAGGTWVAGVAGAAGCQVPVGGAVGGGATALVPLANVDGGVGAGTAEGATCGTATGGVGVDQPVPAAGAVAGAAAACSAEATAASTAASTSLRIDSRSRNVIITPHVEGAVAEAAVVGALADACGRGIP